ncbi:hypothetical protein ACJX0J_027149, partial [Zea mays]
MKITIRIILHIMLYAQILLCAKVSAVIRNKNNRENMRRAFEQATKIEKNKEAELHLEASKSKVNTIIYRNLLTAICDSNKNMQADSYQFHNNVIYASKGSSDAISSKFLRWKESHGGGSHFFS